jgi:prepilin-type N-terminal cleavage/methylation domain-containing protein
MSSQKSVTGFTLVETMFAMVIFSVLFAIIFQFMMISTQSWTDAEIKVRMREQTERAFDAIISELRAAGRTTAEVLTNVVPGTVMSGFFVPADAAARGDGLTYALGFHLPILNDQGQVNDRNRIVYYLDTNAQLMRAEVDETADVVINRTVLARNVSFFEVIGRSGALGTVTASAPSRVDIRLNFQNAASLSRRLIFEGDDPSIPGGSSIRGSGTQVSLRNMPAQ